MQGTHRTGIMKRGIDVGMTVLLLCLMAFQVTGRQAHEWIGIAMTVLVIVHQILNRRWYGALFKGRYSAYRILQTVNNVLLLVCFAVTAVCGMAMSGSAVPFLHGIVKISTARSLHLAMSHWTFVIMGVHLGLHIPVMAAGMARGKRSKDDPAAAGGKSRSTAGIVPNLIFCALAAAGLFLFLRNGMPDYLLFRSRFAFMDYDKSGLIVFLENILMLVFWAFVGTQAARLCRGPGRC